MRSPLTPVMMPPGQAGRHMKAYRDLVKDYPTFREVRMLCPNNPPEYPRL